MTRLLCALLGLSLLGSACSSSRDEPGAKEPTFPVKGRVYLDGEPLAGVFIVFHPFGGDAKAPKAYGRTGRDGVFTLSTHKEGDGAPAGHYAVTILWPDGESLIPKYTSPETSGLRVEVKQGDNEPAVRLRSP
jgi:hypothetical protein